MDELKERMWAAKLAVWLLGPGLRACARLEPAAAGAEARGRALCLGDGGRDDELERLVDRAEWLAVAADRPLLPDPEPGRASRPWEGHEVAFSGLTHPLSGQRCEVTLPARPQVYRRLLDIAGDLTTAAEDRRRAFLRLWRIGPDGGLKPRREHELWPLLPADPRIPDQSLWEHLSLTSAFAGALAGDEDGVPALLAMSLGPVQSFIAQARTTSDLWAGSHLLAAMSWEAMRVVCEECGPDAILFPNLHAVPFADLWLEESGVHLGEGVPWRGRGAYTDANPLFAATLPNRFVAIVPASRAHALAETVRQRVQSWAQRTALEAALQAWQQAEGKQAAGQAQLPEPIRCQVVQQLEGFPELHWASVAWSALGCSAATEPGGPIGDTDRGATTLQLLRGDAQGLLDRGVQLLREPLSIDGVQVLVPGPGMFYPVVHELLDRVGLAAKATRTFDSRRQEGYRCSVTAEDEWLSPAPESDRFKHPGRARDTMWTRLAARDRSWLRNGEHLGAIATLKRRWPALFMQRVRERMGEHDGQGKGGSWIRRYVVSTHTMALAASFNQWVDGIRGGAVVDNAAWGKVAKEACEAAEQVALPRRLAGKLRDDAARATLPGDAAAVIAKIPDRLDELRDSSSARHDPDGLRRFEGELKALLGHTPEAYYALILMDGDHMGGWISGTAEGARLGFGDTWNKELREHWRNEPELAPVLAERRPVSPGRHVAISRALNGFSQHVARHVVEELYLGKLIYSGGDDVLAMVSVDELLGCMLSLRCAYSGAVPPWDGRLAWELLPWLQGAGGRQGEPRALVLENGFARMRSGARQTLLRMMGERATASMGVVVAHHTAPLRAVLGELRRAERRAKEDGGRNAFSITLMKRAGGTTFFTAGWGFGGPAASGDTAGLLEATPMGVLLRLRDTLSLADVSRRVVFHILSWLVGVAERPGQAGGLAEADFKRMLVDAITYQLRRQDRRGAEREPGHRALAQQLTRVAMQRLNERSVPVPEFIRDLLTVAEFLAREGRGFGIAADLQRDSAAQDKEVAR